MNIVDLITGQLNKDVIGSLGSLIGQGPDKTRSAVGAGVPALLAGLTSLVSKPEGSNALDSVLAKQDTSILGNLAGTLGSPQGAALSQQGGNVLGSLFGNNVFSGLTSGLSNFLGLGQGSVKSLLGALAPIVLGFLAKQKASMGLDARGLASMLLGQKQNIMGAMPAGLGSALSSIPGLGSFLSGAGETVSPAASTAMGAAKAGGRQVTDAAVATASGGASALRWIIPLVLVLLGILILTRIIGQKSRDTTSTVSPPISNITQTVSTEATKFTTDLTAIATSAKDALTGIKDAASAEQALPKLREVNTQLNGLKAGWNALPAAARSTIAPTVKEIGRQISELAAKAAAIPGVGDILKPVLDQINATLTSFAQ